MTAQYTGEGRDTQHPPQKKEYGKMKTKKSTLVQIRPDPDLAFIYNKEKEQLRQQLDKLKFPLTFHCCVCKKLMYSIVIEKNTVRNLGLLFAKHALDKAYFLVCSKKCFEKKFHPITVAFKDIERIL